MVVLIVFLLPLGGGAMGAVRAFETIAFILLVIILILLLVHICASPNLQLVLVSAICAFVAGNRLQFVF